MRRGSTRGSTTSVSGRPAPSTWRCTCSAATSGSCPWSADRTATARRRSRRRRARATAIAWTAGTSCPTRRRAGSPTACTARRRSSTRPRSRGPTSCSRRRRCPSSCSTSCTSARSRPRARSTAAIERLDDLVELGVTAVEIMPVAQFPGSRNWGYDGVYLCGAAVDLRRARRPAAPRRRLPRARPRRRPRRRLQPPRPRGQLPRASSAPYFTDRYHTPWGEAVNFDGPGSDEVRRFFCDNALALARRVPRRRPPARRGPRHRRHVGRAVLARAGGGRRRSSASTGAGVSP